jgi:hypothetical protein
MPVYQFGGEDENGIIHLHINYLYLHKIQCFRAKFGQIWTKIRFRATPP